MPTLHYTVPPEKDGAPVRHILKAELHFSARAISRLTRTEGGILRNGQPVRTVDFLHTGDELSVLSSDLRPVRQQPPVPRRLPGGPPFRQRTPPPPAIWPSRTSSSSFSPPRSGKWRT